MKVEIWSDYVCPFCYLGKRRFETALEQFSHKEKVEVVYKSYELNPNAAKENNPSTVEMLMSKYGMSREQALANTKQINQQAAEAGLEYHLEDAIQTNTFDAHRLTHYAATKGKLGEMTERLLKAHFTDLLHLGKVNVLADLAEEAGLDRDEALAVIKDETAYADEVRQDEQEAAALNVRGVPFFVINRKYGVSGAQPAEVFLEALNKAWEEHQPLVTFGEANEVCTDDGCVVPGKDDE